MKRASPDKKVKSALEAFAVKNGPKCYLGPKNLPPKFLTPPHPFPNYRTLYAENSIRDIFRRGEGKFLKFSQIICSTWVYVR